MGEKGRARPSVQGGAWAGWGNLHEVEETSDHRTSGTPIFPDEVVEGVKAGQADAIGEVYVRLADRLLGYILARVRDRATAEDLLEATFVELIQRGCTINGGASAIKVWLFRAAHFNVLDHVRKVSRRGEDLHADLFDIDVIDLDRGPAERAEAAEISREVHAALDELSEDQRQVLLLRYLAGLPTREVALIVDKSEGAVRSLQHRGERALARILLPQREAAPSGGSAASTEKDT